MKILSLTTGASEYADPGFQSDGKKRYPLDTPDRTRAAVRYFGMPKNRAKYSRTQIAHINKKLDEAKKKHKTDSNDAKSDSTSTGTHDPIAFNDTDARSLSTVKIVSEEKPKQLVPPDSDATHFYTAGRLLSYFPVINRNGQTFFREDCQPVLKTLIASLADISHVKPGYGVSDPDNLKNASCGAIVDYQDNEDGIDIVVKNERDVVKAMGFDEDDFRPLEGKYSYFSQESDFYPSDSSWIVVDKSDPAKIVSEVPYDEGIKRGFKLSRYDSGQGKWNYYTVSGNPVFVRIKPIGFSGVGHVIKPADETAEIYTVTADEEGNKALSDVYPGMDSAQDWTAVGPEKSYLSGGPMDYLDHPDLADTPTRDYSSEDLSGTPDHMCAAVWTDDTQDGPAKNKLFRIKKDDGSYDRKRLVYAYHAMSGMRGATHLSRRLPSAVAAHAMALVHKGLEATKPKPPKERTTSMTIEEEVQELQQKLKDMANAPNVELEKVTASLTEKTAEFNEFKEAQTKLVSELQLQIEALNATIAEKDGVLKESADKALASERLLALEAIHPYEEAEKTEDFVKSLATMTEEKLETQVVKRQLAKLQAESKDGKNKSLASVASGTTLSPAPRFEGLDKLEIKESTDII